jgi:hypothetical protein
VAESKSEFRERISRRLTGQGFEYDPSLERKSPYGVFFFDIEKDFLVTETEFDELAKRDRIKGFLTIESVETYLNRGLGNIVQGGVTNGGFSTTARIAPLSRDGMRYGDFINGNYRLEWVNKGIVEGGARG